MSVPGGAGGVFRPYALTGGRAMTAIELPLETLVVATAAGRRGAARLGLEQRLILELCREATSVVELAARLRVPLGVARVLVADLVTESLVELHGPQAADPRTSSYRALLKKVLHGIDEL